jgi:hypothetical protein
MSITESRIILCLVFFLWVFTILMVNAYGKIGAVQLTPAASCAPLGIHPRNAVIIQFYAFTGAKRSADPAGFAPVAKNIYLETPAAWFLASSVCAGSFFHPAGFLADLIVVHYGLAWSPLQESNLYL